MHKCVRCERAATTIEEINEGCPCGSKVFVFIRDANAAEAEAQQKPGVSVAQPALFPTDGAKEKSVPSFSADDSAPGAKEKMPDVVSEGIPSLDFSTAKNASLLQENASQQKPSANPSQTASEKPSGQENGKAPSAYFARTTFTAEDVENIKIVTEGVFAVDINALSKNPVVLKDEEGIYYVRLPFDADGKREIPNGKKK